MIQLRSINKLKPFISFYSTFLKSEAELGVHLQLHDNTEKKSVCAAAVDQLIQLNIHFINPGHHKIKRASLQFQTEFCQLVSVHLNVFYWLPFIAFPHLLLSSTVCLGLTEDSWHI